VWIQISKRQKPWAPMGEVGHLILVTSYLLLLINFVAKVGLGLVIHGFLAKDKIDILEFYNNIIVPANFYRYFRLN
jgi:hypothetical protein